MRLSKFINKHFFNKDIDTVDPNYTIENINVDKKRDELKEGDVIYAAISTTIKENGKKKRLNQRKDLYMLKDSYGKFTFSSVIQILLAFFDNLLFGNIFHITY